MADVRKVEERSAFLEKRKLDEEENSNSNKRQKLEITPENEKDITSFYVIDDKVVESEDGQDSYQTDETDDQDEHQKVESEMVNMGNNITMVDNGEGILIEESEEDTDEDEDTDSSDDSDSDFSDGLDTDSEDDTV